MSRVGYLTVMTSNAEQKDQPRLGLKDDVVKLCGLEVCRDSI